MSSQGCPGRLGVGKRAEEAPLFRPRHYRIEDLSSGLLAFIVIDDTSLGPAAGGIRTHRYASEEAALEDAYALARAMTYKCALAGLPAGGGKGVVMMRSDMDRESAFERLGEFVDSLGGRFLTAGDLGTTHDDLIAMSRHTAHVYTDEIALSEAVGLGCVRAMQACVALRTPGVSDLGGMRIAVQGCGTVGTAVALAAHRQGASLLLADIDRDRAEALAAKLPARVVDADRIFEVDAEIVAPCAAGGVVSEDAVDRLSAWAVCGAANNILAGPEVEQSLREHGVVWVPDPLSSAGAVIEGIGRMVLGLDDCSRLVDRVFETTRLILAEAQTGHRLAGEVARALAHRRILAARGEPE